MGCYTKGSLWLATRLFMCVYAETVEKLDLPIVYGFTFCAPRLDMILCWENPPSLILKGRWSHTL